MPLAARLTDAVAVPALTLLAYTGVGVMLRPGAVAVALHGVSAGPLNTTENGQVTVTVGDTGLIVIAAVAVTSLKTGLPAPQVTVSV